MGSFYLRNPLLPYGFYADNNTKRQPGKVLYIQFFYGNGIQPLLAIPLPQYQVQTH
jgi:hypothetical protein